MTARAKSVVARSMVMTIDLAATDFASRSPTTSATSRAFVLRFDRD